MTTAIVADLDPQPASGYTSLGTIKSTASSATLTSPILRPYRTTSGPNSGETTGVTIPQIAFPAGWDGDDLVITGLDASGAAQSETVIKNPGSTVAATGTYSRITGVTNATPGADTSDATIQCSEGWHIQMRTTNGIRVGVAGTLVVSTERGVSVTESYSAEGICFGDIAIVDPTSTATGCVARGNYGRGRP